MKLRGIHIPRWLIILLPLPIGLAGTGLAHAQQSGQFSDPAVIAAVFGALGSLVTGIPLALKMRSDAKRADRKDELDGLRAIIDELSEDQKRRAAEREKSRTDYRRLSIELDQERKARRELAARMTEYETRCTEKDQEIEDLRGELGKQSLEMAQLRAEIARRDERIAALTTELETVRSDMAAKDERMAEMSAEMEELRTIVEKNDLLPARARRKAADG